jgi:hypothetical protein
MEEIIINSLKSLLPGRVNEFLWGTVDPHTSYWVCHLPGWFTVVPVISLSTCERSEKERVVQQDAYTLTSPLPYRNTRRQNGTVKAILP